MGISELKSNQLFETVHPCLVSKKSYIGNVNGVMNAVILNGKPVGESVLQGEGAGPGPTSSSLLSDLLSILRGNIKKPFGVSVNKLKTLKTYNVNNYVNSLYLRFEVKDRPGVLSQITNRLAKYKISVKRLIQTPDKKIIDTVKKIGGNAILTAENHQTGTDRVFEVFKKNLNANPNIIVNLQGDMPNISPETINNLVNYMNKGHCEIGTLASKLISNEELDNENIVKVLSKTEVKNEYVTLKP